MIAWAIEKRFVFYQKYFVRISAGLAKLSLTVQRACFLQRCDRFLSFNGGFGFIRIISWYSKDKTTVTPGFHPFLTPSTAPLDHNKCLLKR
jgi:hypothetical protein